MAELTVFGALRNAMTAEKSLYAIQDYRDGWGRLFEPYSGAWQIGCDERHIGCDEKRETMLCYPTQYACLNRISQDVGKLPFQLKRIDGNGIWKLEPNNTAYWPVLRKPNPYQTQQQFRESWVLSKLIHGNTYVLKGRDNRGVVNRMDIIDPWGVLPLVSDMGDVYYRLHFTTAQNLLPEEYPAKELIVPASEIIHDRLNTFWHPLIGVPPLCAAHWPAVKNLKILKDATAFFSNGANPGGILTAPAGLSETDADAIKTYWATNFTGKNSGKVAVIGADMKFTPFAFKSADSQMIEQMKYSDEQICQTFGVPPFKIGIGQIPAGLGVDAINQLYYADALQGHIEAMEYLLDDGLSITPPLGVELDTEPLLRMDEGKKAEVESALVGGKIKTPDEARIRFGLAPTGGGDTLWGQQQDYPLGMLADRANWDPNMQGNAPEPAPPQDQTPKALAVLWRRAPESLCHA